MAGDFGNPSWVKQPGLPNTSPAYTATVQSASAQDLREFQTLVLTHNQGNMSDQVKMVNQFGNALLGP